MPRALRGTYRGRGGVGCSDSGARLMDAIAAAVITALLAGAMIGSHSPGPIWRGFLCTERGFVPLSVHKTRIIPARIVAPQRVGPTDRDYGAMRTSALRRSKKFALRRRRVLLL